MGSLSFEFFNPGEDADFDDTHDSGLAFRVTYGESSFLFTGDAHSDAEQRMVPKFGEQLSADVYQVGHHGADTSSSEAFLEYVQPAYAVYSAGEDNPYGHPGGEAVQRLLEAGAAVYGTDVHGTVTFTTAGDGEYKITTSGERDHPIGVDIAVRGVTVDTDGHVPGAGAVTDWMVPQGAW